MNFATGIAGLLLPGSAQAFTCAQAIWAMQTFTPAELRKLAAPCGGISKADRVKALRCLRDANSKGRDIRIKVHPLRSAS